MPRNFGHPPPRPEPAMLYDGRGSSWELALPIGVILTSVVGLVLFGIFIA